MSGAVLTLLWVAVALMMAVGVAGTVLPAIPGVALVFAGAVVGAWIGDFREVGGWTVALIGALGVIALGVDYAAAALGARRVGASRLALVGAVIGTVLGVMSGLWGLLFMPLAGAAIGEYLERRDLPRAGAVGMATWLGLLLGAVLKLAITFAMIGVFVTALIL